MKENESLIVIEQLPVIVEQLQAVKARWAEIAATAKTMVATDDTIQSIKAQRAEMRKEYDTYDKQRIAAKKQYMAPWEAVEATYKECVKDAYMEADAALKGTVDGFENELKGQCEKELREYYAELCEFERLDFMTFEQAMSLAGLKITLADAKSAGRKKLREGLTAIVAKVSADCDNIMEMEDDALIMDEYKRCLDLGQAVAIVQGRKRRIEAEKQAAEERRAAKEREAARVESIPVTVEAPEVTKDEPEELYDVRFTCYGITKAQARKIKEFLEREGINYGK